MAWHGVLPRQSTNPLIVVQPYHKIFKGKPVLSPISNYYLESDHTSLCWVVLSGRPSCPNSGQFTLACQADMDLSNHDPAGLGTASFYMV